MWIWKGIEKKKVLYCLEKCFPSASIGWVSSSGKTEEAQKLTLGHGMQRATWYPEDANVQVCRSTTNAHLYYVRPYRGTCSSEEWS